MLRARVEAADCSGNRPRAGDGKRRSQRALLQLSALPLPMLLVQPAILGRRDLEVMRMDGGRRALHRPPAADLSENRYSVLEAFPLRVPR
jgi:hypothetical protein